MAAKWLDRIGSADKPTMDGAKAKGGTSGTPVEFATNYIQMAVPAANPAKIGSVQDLDKSGVKYVTIYAFSIENFKRSKYEVDGLMDMAKTRLAQMCQHGALFERYGAAVRVLGDRGLVREDVLEHVDKAIRFLSNINYDL